MKQTTEFKVVKINHEFKKRCLLSPQSLIEADVGSAKKSGQLQKVNYWGVVKSNYCILMVSLLLGGVEMDLNSRITRPFLVYNHHLRSS
jgi:hypothetical protein